jgi:hypothetical protein
MNIKVTKAFEKIVFKIKEKEVKASLLETIQHIQKAGNLTQIPNIKPIVGHKDYYRVVVATRYRLGIKFEDNIVWLLFFGIRNEKTYKLFP